MDDFLAERDDALQNLLRPLIAANDVERLIDRVNKHPDAALYKHRVLYMLRDLNAPADMIIRAMFEYVFDTDPHTFLDLMYDIVEVLLERWKDYFAKDNPLMRLVFLAYLYQTDHRDRILSKFVPIRDAVDHIERMASLNELIRLSLGTFPIYADRFERSDKMVPRLAFLRRVNELVIHFPTLNVNWPNPETARLACRAAYDFVQEHTDTPEGAHWSWRYADSEQHKKGAEETLRAIVSACLIKPRWIDDHLYSHRSLIRDAVTYAFKTENYVAMFHWMLPFVHTMEPFDLFTSAVQRCTSHVGFVILYYFVAATADFGRNYDESGETTDALKAIITTGRFSREKIRLALSFIPRFVSYDAEDTDTFVINVIGSVTNTCRHAGDLIERLVPTVINPLDALALALYHGNAAFLERVLLAISRFPLLDYIDTHFPLLVRAAYACHLALQRGPGQTPNPAEVREIRKWSEHDINHAPAIDTGGIYVANATSFYKLIMSEEGYRTKLSRGSIRDVFYAVTLVDMSFVNLVRCMATNFADAKPDDNRRHFCALIVNFENQTLKGRFMHAIEELERQLHIDGHAFRNSLNIPADQYSARIQFDELAQSELEQDRSSRESSVVPTSSGDESDDHRVMSETRQPRVRYELAYGHQRVHDYPDRPPKKMKEKRLLRL